MMTTDTPTVIGFDPGERWVGIVARRGDLLLGHTIADRGEAAVRTREHAELDGWLATIVDELEQLADVLASCPDHPGEWAHLSTVVDLVAVELTTRPSSFLGMTDPGPIIDTAQAGGAAYGWALARGIRTRFVTPTRHGMIDLPAGTPAKVARQALEQSYPAELIGPRETSGRGKSPLQHVRAAWDVAGAGAQLLRYRRGA